jgi:uncharacterized membrane protein YbhN (UPF0104 family)
MRNFILARREKSSSLRFTGRSAIKLVLTVLFLIFLFYIVHPEEIIAALSQANFIFVAIALLLLPVNLGLQFLRWKHLAKLSSENVANRDVMRSIFCSFSYSIFTPARIGEVGRAFHIPSGKRDELVVLAFYEKFFAFCSLLIWGFLGLGIAMSPLYLLGVIAMIALVLSSKFLVRFIPWLRKWNDTIYKVPTLKIFLISLVFVLVYMLQFLLILNGFKPVSPLEGFPLISIVLLLNSVPITFSGLGIREVFSVYFFERLGVSGASAASGSLLLFFINILIPTFIGFGLLVFGRRDA